jgi:hypothetical protein
MAFFECVTWKEFRWQTRHIEFLSASVAMLEDAEQEGNWKPLLWILGMYVGLIITYNAQDIVHAVVSLPAKRICMSWSRTSSGSFSS